MDESLLLKTFKVDEKNEKFKESDILDMPLIVKD